MNTQPNPSELPGFNYRKLFEHFNVAFIRVSEKGLITEANVYFNELIKDTSFFREANLNLTDLFSNASTQKMIKQCLKKRGIIQQHFGHIETAKGQSRWIELTLYPASSEGSEPMYFEGMLRDVTHKKLMEINDQIALLFFDNALEGIIITDENTHIIRVNHVFEEITGYTEEEVLGSTPKMLKSNLHSDDFYRRLWTSLKHRGKWEGEIQNRRKSGEIYSQWLTILSIKEEKKIVNYLGIFTNIHADHESTRRLSYMAYHDSLTGLPNRQLLLDRLEQILEKSNREEDEVAVLFLDLDGFKLVNDTYGHLYGDQLLMMVADRLQKNVRRSDTVARLGGDEFCIILSGINQENDVHTIVNYLAKILTEPYIIEEHESHLTVSIGVSTYPKDGEDPYKLLENADRAMYQVKNSGKNNICYYYDCT